MSAQGSHSNGCIPDMLLILMPFFCWRSGDKEESTIQRIVSRLVSVLQTPMHKLRTSPVNPSTLASAPSNSPRPVVATSSRLNRLSRSMRVITLCGGGWEGSTGRRMTGAAAEDVLFSAESSAMEGLLIVSEMGALVNHQRLKHLINREIQKPHKSMLGSW